MDERTETQTILPAETEKLVKKQKQLKGYERIEEKESEERRHPFRKSTVQAFKEHKNAVLNKVDYSLASTASLINKYCQILTESKVKTKNLLKTVVFNFSGTEN